MRLIPPIRLSTALLLMFFAGGWIWLNTIEIVHFRPEPYMMGVKPSSEQWVETKDLPKELQDDSPLKPGFTQVKIPAVYETKTRLVCIWDGQGFPFGIARSNYTITGAPFESIVILPLMGNILIGLLVLWNAAVVLAWCFPIKENKN